MENNIEYSEEIEKVINQKNTECAMFDSPECVFLNVENCSECAVGKLSKDKQASAKAALGRLMEAAPQYMLEPLYSGDRCLFCKGGGRNEASCYGLFDLSKRDEEGDWTIAIGKKQIGVKHADMILPLQVSCCSDCRKKHRLIAYIPTIIAIVIAAIGLVLTTITPIYNAAYNVAPWLPAVMMLGFILVGIGLAFLVKKLMVRSFGKTTRLDASTIPAVKPLIERGFEEVNKKGAGVSNVVFSRNFREHGVGSLKTGEYTHPVTDVPDDDPFEMGIWPAENFNGCEDEPEEPEGTEE